MKVLSYESGDYVDVNMSSLQGYVVWSSNI